MPKRPPWPKQLAESVPCNRPPRIKSESDIKKEDGDRGCGSVGRAVASNTKGRRFKSSHWQNLYLTFAYCQLNRKDENKEKETGNGPFKKGKYSNE